MAVELLDGVRGIVGIRVLDESEAAGAPRVPIRRKDDLDDVPDLREQLFELVGLGFEIEIADK